VVRVRFRVRVRPAGELLRQRPRRPHLPDILEHGRSTNGALADLNIRPQWT